jgi:hypothetical protein
MGVAVGEGVGVGVGDERGVAVGVRRVAVGGGGVGDTKAVGWRFAWLQPVRIRRKRRRGKKSRGFKIRL